MILPSPEPKVLPGVRLCLAILCAALAQACGAPDPDPADESTSEADGAATTTGYLELYTTKMSYLPGEAVEFHVSTTSPSYTLEIVRDGWTQTSVAQLGTFTGAYYTTPPAAQEPWRTGAGWPVAATWTVPSGLTTGSYFVRARTTGGTSAYWSHPFVVRSATAGSRSRVAFLMNFNTRNAYNQWGGKSLYVSNVSGDARHGVAVSFQRPLPGLGACYSGQKAVASELEADGFAPEYLTEWDLQANPDVLKSYRVVVLACHHEYISRLTYKALSDHHARGGDLALFSGDDIFWQVRYDATGSTMIGYRDYALTEDPMVGVNDSLVTTVWAGPSLNRPPARLLGVTYQTASEDFQDADFIVQDSSHWIFAGTGLHDGDALGNHMASIETDYTTADSPATMDRLLEGLRSTPLPGISPPVPLVRALAVYYADSAAYGFPNGNGGQVFASGSTRGWGDSLMSTSPGYEAVRQATRNIVQHMLDN